MLLCLDFNDLTTVGWGQYDKGDRTNVALVVKKNIHASLPLEPCYTEGVLKEEKKGKNEKKRQN